VDDPGTALRDIAKGYAERIRAEMVVVTGSAGKSSVKDMTAGMLSTAFSTARTQGNWNNDVGLPLSLLAMEESTQIGVFELGISHPGEMAQLCGMLKPQWAVITNIGPVHIEFFGSVEAVAREKARVFEKMPGDGAVVLNRDSDCFDLLRSLAPARVSAVSMRSDADYRCMARNAMANEAVAREKATGDEFKFRLSVPGEHNVMNAMLAMAVARGHGVGWDGIAAALAAFSPLPMRWEVMWVNGVKVINDAYNANPMSMKASIRAFSETEHAGRKWLVLGGMLELGAVENEEHFRLGRSLKSDEWAGLIGVGRLGGVIADGAADAGLPAERIFRCRDADEATEVIGNHVKKGEAVLLKASRGIHLEDVVKRWKEKPTRQG
jgi:UDP-N-acetylmuramoyl-tripeptide--D-alanyl-D-alanine ligase